ncbi:MAG: efflux RND transporter periplasmic adaptor subunit [Actinomycetota bacterium]|nr:efflux RND transporter periplasmic adaptor subunit [Actinomycetota bacterium]
MRGRFILPVIVVLAILVLPFLARADGVTGAGVIEEGRINISLPQLQPTAGGVFGRAASATSTAGPAPLGRVILYVGAGDRVGNGQKLARLDSDVWRLAAKRDKATVARAEGGLSVIKDRLAELSGKKSELRQGLGRMQSALEQAKIKAALQVDVAKQTAGRSLERWRWTTVRAPRAGRVLALMANSGELIYPNQTLMQLGTGEFDLKLYLDPATAVRARPGMSASVFVDAYPSQPLKAKVTRLVPEVEPAPTNLATDVIRLFDVQAVILRVKDRGGILKAGLPADAVINFK